MNNITTSKALGPKADRIPSPFENVKIALENLKINRKSPSPTKSRKSPSPTKKKSKDVIQIFVTGFEQSDGLGGNKTIPFMVRKEDAILGLMKKIKLSQKIPTSLQGLCYNGKILQPHLTFSNYGIDKGSTIFYHFKWAAIVNKKQPVNETSRSIACREWH